MIGVQVDQKQLQKQLNRLRDASLRIADTNNANRAVAVPNNLDEIIKVIKLYS